MATHTRQYGRRIISFPSKTLRLFDRELYLSGGEVAMRKDRVIDAVSVVFLFAYGLMAFATLQASPTWPSVAGVAFVGVLTFVLLTEQKIDYVEIYNGGLIQMRGDRRADDADEPEREDEQFR